MDYISEINKYIPKNEQEEQDKKVIISCMQLFPYNILSRDNEIAHITSSGLILNDNLSKALFIHHNIRNTWAWTGGHADSNPNLLEVSIHEAMEETGVSVVPISNEIAAIDVLSSIGHIKNGKYINNHLHLSVAYLFTASEDAPTIIKPDENSGIEWFPVEQITSDLFNERDVSLYTKLIQQAKMWLQN